LFLLLPGTQGRRFASWLAPAARKFQESDCPGILGEGSAKERKKLVNGEVGPGGNAVFPKNLKAITGRTAGADGSGQLAYGLLLREMR
jgi:hypothetical protein